MESERLLDLLGCSGNGQSGGSHGDSYSSLRFIVRSVPAARNVGQPSLTRRDGEPESYFYDECR